MSATSANSLHTSKGYSITDPDIVMCLSGYDPENLPKPVCRDLQGRLIRQEIPTALPTNTDAEAAIGLVSNMTLLGRRLWYWQQNFEFITNEKVIAKVSNDISEIIKRLPSSVGDKSRKDRLLRASEKLEVIYAALVKSDAPRKNVAELGIRLHPLYKKLWVEVMFEDSELLQQLEPITGRSAQTASGSKEGIEEGLKKSINEAIDEIIQVRLETGDAIAESDLIVLTQGLAKKFRSANTMHEVERIKKMAITSIRSMAKIRELTEAASLQDIPIDYLNALLTKALTSIIKCDTEEHIFQVVQETEIAIKQQIPSPQIEESKNRHRDTRCVVAAAFQHSASSKIEESSKVLPSQISPGDLTIPSLINMSWLLNWKLDSSELKKINEYAAKIYDKTQTQEKVRKAEWHNLAKAWILLSPYERQPNSVIEEVVLKYTLTHQPLSIDPKKSKLYLPPEFLELIGKEKLKESVLNHIRYYTCCQFSLASDLNGNGMLETIRSAEFNAKQKLHSIVKKPTSDLHTAIRQLNLLKIKPFTEGKSKSESKTKDERSKELQEMRAVIETFSFALATGLCWNEPFAINEHWEKLQLLIESITQSRNSSKGNRIAALNALHGFSSIVDIANMRDKAMNQPQAIASILNIAKNKLKHGQITLIPEEARILLEYGYDLLSTTKATVIDEELICLCQIAKKLSGAAQMTDQKLSPAAKAARAYLTKYAHLERRLGASKTIQSSASMRNSPLSITILTEPKKILNRQKAFYDLILAPKLSIAENGQKIELDRLLDSIKSLSGETEDVAEMMQLLENNLNTILTPLIGCQQGDINLKVIAEWIKGGVSEKKLALRLQRRFNDQGLALLRDFVYPYVVCDSISKLPNGSSLTASLKPAMASELATLVPDEHNRVRLLIGLIKGMDSVLNGGYVRGSSQVKMLQKCIEAVNGNKTVLIQAKPGSGKTTMVRLFGTAFPICNSNLTAIIHVAPFAQNDPSWIPLNSFKDLNTSAKAPLHYSITANNLYELLEGEIPDDSRQWLINSLFINDEYDHPDFVKVHQQLSSLGCKRNVNVSATGSMVQMENRIKHWKAKIAFLQRYLKKLPENGMRVDEIAKQNEKIARYLLHIQEVDAYMTSLKEKMKAEFHQRSIRFYEGKETELATLREIFNEINLLPNSISGSFLVEIPHASQVKGEIIIELMGQPKVATTILNREIADSGIGILLAHQWSAKEKQWHRITFDEYKRLHQEKNDGLKAVQPRVICVYGKDSAGGDFERFSNTQIGQKTDVSDGKEKELAKRQTESYPRTYSEGVGRHNTQYLLFSNEVSGIQQTYQNLSRLRRSSEDVSLLPPIKIFLGQELFSRIKNENQQQMKNSFLTLAQAKAGKDELAAEEVRLLDKIKRKIFTTLKLLIRGQLGSWITVIAKAASLDEEHPWILNVQRELKRLAKEQLDHVESKITDKTDTNKLSIELSETIKSSYVPPSRFIGPDHQKELQIAEGMYSLYERFFSLERSFQTSLSQLAQGLLAEGDKLPFAALWPKFIERQLIKKPLFEGVADSMLHRLRRPLGDTERERLGNRRLRANVIAKEVMIPAPGKLGILRIITAWDAPTMAVSLTGLRSHRIEHYKSLLEEVKLEKKLQKATHFFQKAEESKSRPKFSFSEDRLLIADMSARIKAYQTDLSDTRSEIQPTHIHAMPLP